MTLTVIWYILKLMSIYIVYNFCFNNYFPGFNENKQFLKYILGCIFFSEDLYFSIHQLLYMFCYSLYNLLLFQAYQYNKFIKFSVHWFYNNFIFNLMSKKFLPNFSKTYLYDYFYYDDNYLKLQYGDFPYVVRAYYYYFVKGTFFFSITFIFINLIYPLYFYKDFYMFNDLFCTYYYTYSFTGFFFLKLTVILNFFPVLYFLLENLRIIESKLFSFKVLNIIICISFLIILFFFFEYLYILKLLSWNTFHYKKLFYIYEIVISNMPHKSNLSGDLYFLNHYNYLEPKLFYLYKNVCYTSLMKDLDFIFVEKTVYYKFYHYNYFLKLKYINHLTNFSFGYYNFFILGKFQIYF